MSSGYLTVEVLTVPARWEMVDSHDASRAWLFWKVVRLAASRHDIFQARKPQARILPSSSGGATDSHTETLTL